MAVLLYVLVPVWAAALAVFVLGLVVELVGLHVRRRRFGEAQPAWKNDPTPPPYS